MKRLLPLLLLCLLGTTLWAQTGNKLIVTMGYSNSQPLYNKTLNGGPSFNGNGTASVGLRYVPQSKNALSLETGVEYIHHRYTIHSNLPPNVAAQNREEKLQMLSIPLYARLSFLKYLFFQCGPLLDIELNKKNSIQRQTGMGLGAGIGGSINLGKFALMINPFFQRHALIGFSKNEGTGQSMINGGVRLGLGYTF